MPARSLYGGAISIRDNGARFEQQLNLVLGLAHFLKGNGAQGRIRTTDTRIFSLLLGTHWPHHQAKDGSRRESILIYMTIFHNEFDGVFIILKDRHVAQRIAVNEKKVGISPFLNHAEGPVGIWISQSGQF